MKRVAISRVHFPVTTLGPGRRVGVWLQGCSIRCPGCISVDTWNPDAGMVPLADLLGALSAVAAVADGLTVSGGEPFDQPVALAALLTHWRSVSLRPTFVFTGRELDDVAPWLRANHGLIDALMTGPFRSDIPQTLAMRGSDNQQLQVLTGAGAEMISYERPTTAADRRLDVMCDADGYAWLAGIPARGELARLRRALASSGHRATTSDTVGTSAS